MGGGSPIKAFGNDKLVLTEVGNGQCITYLPNIYAKSVVSNVFYWSESLVSLTFLMPPYQTIPALIHPASFLPCERNRGHPPTKVLSLSLPLLS